MGPENRGTARYDGIVRNAHGRAVLRVVVAEGAEDATVEVPLTVAELTAVIRDATAAAEPTETPSGARPAVTAASVSATLGRPWLVTGPHRSASRPSAPWYFVIRRGDARFQAHGLSPEAAADVARMTAQAHDSITD